MKFLEILKLIVALLPLLIETMKMIEEAIPGTGKGEAKLVAVRSVVETSYNLSSNVGLAFEQIWPALQKTIAGIVASFNAVGIFKK